MPDTPFTIANRIVQRIVADLGEGAVPGHLIGEWTGFIAAEIWEHKNYPGATTPAIEGEAAESDASPSPKL